MRRWILFLALLVMVSGSRLARADGDPLARPTNVEALAHLERGEALYALQKWDEAIVELEQGALVEPSLPVWFLSLGQAHRKAGHYQRARWYYERFLSRVDGVQGVEEIVATVRKLIADMEAAENRPPVDMAPSSPSGKTTERVGPAPSRWTKRRKVALGLGASGLVAVGTGVALSLHAQGLRDDAAALCPSVSCADASRANDLSERASTGDRNALVAYGVGGAAVAGAVVLWLLGAPEHSTFEPSPFQ